MSTTLTFSEKIKKAVKKNKSSLIVGLDIDLDKIPVFIKSEKDALFIFAKAIIDATSDEVAAYKPNMAFFEAYGAPGLEQLKRIINYIPSHIPVILDAKRGDIGNTARMYARSIFEYYNADAVTLSPYMGADAIIPFLEYKAKYSFVLVLTSNPGSADIEQQTLKNNNAVYAVVAGKVKELNKKYSNCGAVVGATKPKQFAELSKILKGSYILIPGIGTQGGSIEDVFANCHKDMKDKCLFNVSRDIIYSSDKYDFANQARKKAKFYKEEINRFKE